MKHIVLICLIASLNFLFSCKESTVDPNSNPNSNKTQVEKILKNSSWVLESSESIPSGDPAVPLIMTFQENNVFKAKQLEDSKKSFGSWEISENGDTLRVIEKDSITYQIKGISDFKITKINNEELEFELKETATKTIYFKFLKIPNNAIFAIAGKVANSKNIDINNANISVIWDVSPGQGSYAANFGYGEFRANKTKFVAYFTNLPNDLELMGDNLKFGVAYIFLFKELIPQNQVVDKISNYSFLGGISNFGLIYQTKTPEATDEVWWQWQRDFNIGFNTAIGVPGQSGENDYWVKSNMSLILTVDTTNNSIIIPNWH